MSTNISFRGEVNEMSAAYFIREMELLPARSSATIYLHTPGGDIYAGGEMINSFRAAMKRGCKFSLEIGSLCASMGAALLAAARASGCRVSAHANTEAMFHGCWSIIVGGADELTDQAKAMRDFNECVKRDLAKCGVTDTDDWFAADRQKWLNAQELQSLGLVDDIIEDAATDADPKTDAVKLAAKLNHKEIPMTDEPHNEVVETTVAATPTPDTPKDETVSTIVPTAEEPVNEQVPDAIEKTVDDVRAEYEAKLNDMANERFAKLQAKHDKMISDLTKERDLALKDLEAAKATATSLQADVEKLGRDLADTRDQLAHSEQTREDIVSGALAPDTELPTMKDGLAACTTPAERSAFLASGKYRKN